MQNSSPVCTIKNNFWKIKNKAVHNCYLIFALTSRFTHKIQLACILIYKGDIPTIINSSKLHF